MGEGLGFIGIVAALLGKLTVGGTVVASVLYGGLTAGLVATFILYFMTCIVVHRQSAVIAFLVIGMIYSLAFSGVVAVFTGVHRVEQFECEWSAAHADLVEIDLGSIGGFGKARVESEQLIEHLRKDQPPKVHVSVRIVRDFGRVRARGRVEYIDGIQVHEVGWQ